MSFKSAFQWYHSHADLAGWYLKNLKNLELHFLISLFIASLYIFLNETITSILTKTILLK